MRLGRLLVPLAAALLAACAGPRPVPLPDWEGSDEGRSAAREWLEQSQGFDALAAYELLGFRDPIRFALARRWSAEGVGVLSYVTEPKAWNGVIFLTEREPGERTTVSVKGPRSRSVQRTTSSRGPLPASGDPFSLSSEVAMPMLPADFEFRLRPDEDVAGEPCRVIESRPVTPQRGFNRIVSWISIETGVALRKVYYRGDEEVRSVHVDPEDVREYEGRFAAARLEVHTADGTKAELLLHRLVPDIDLPASLFTERGVRRSRFPKF